MRPFPNITASTYRKRHARQLASDARGEAAGETKGRVVLFATCYGNRNEPELGEDLAAVFEHNGIPVTI